jgi:hypothetical protein
MNSFFCFLSAQGTKQASFSEGKKRGKFGGRNRFFARFPSSSSDLKRRENAKGNVKGNGMSRKSLMEPEEARHCEIGAGMRAMRVSAGDIS